MSKMGGLVLSRRKDEEIVITTDDGTVIEVLVVEVCEGKVRLRVAAPKCVTIHRREIQDLIDKEPPDDSSSSSD